MIQRISILLSLVACCSYALGADPSRRAGVDFNEPTALSGAVAQFNAQVKRISEIGRAQPDLTVDEVVAAIRAWDIKKNPIEPELLAVFRTIADTELLPAGSQLGFTTGWDPGRGYRYTVWWVNLNVSAPNPEKENSRIGYGFRIRDRILSSRPSTSSFEHSSTERQRYIAKYLTSPSNDTDN